MIHGKLTYIGLAVALGYGVSACSSSDAAVASTDAGQTGNGGSGAGGSTSTGGNKSTGGGGTTSTGGGGTTSTGGSGTTEGGVPSIKITSPANNADITITGDPDVALGLDVKNFTLMAAGTCPAGNTGCGHVHIIVDPAVGNGKTCNAVGFPYNSAYPDATEDAKAGASAGLDYCQGGIPGNHTIVAELHHDNHTPVNDSAGKVISDKIIVNVTTGGGDAGDGGSKDAGNKG